MVVALDQLAVVDLHGHPWQRQGGEGLGHDQRHLRLVVQRQGARVDDVDVGLQELAVPTFLRPLPSPHLLDLVAPEGELQLARILQHVAGERHGQVEMEGELAVGITLGVVVGGQAPHAVDLLVDLALGQQLLDGLDRTRLDVGETVQLERAT